MSREDVHGTTSLRGSRAESALGSTSPSGRTGLKEEVCEVHRLNLHEVVYITLLRLVGGHGVLFMPPESIRDTTGMLCQWQSRRHVI
jgi:hypothetical protein